jgi:hypothetical protein
LDLALFKQSAFFRESATGFWELKLTAPISPKSTGLLAGELPLRCVFPAGRENLLDRPCLLQELIVSRAYLVGRLAMPAVTALARPSPSFDSINISTFYNPKKILAALGALCGSFKFASVFDQALSS